MKLVFCFIILLPRMFWINATNYCSQDICSDNRIHIGCKNSGEFSSVCPEIRKFHDLTKHRKKILKRHNYYRNLMASGLNGKFPTASRMATMIWDSELAYLAGLNVKTCIFAHDKCRNTDKFQHSGQNLAYSERYDEQPRILKMVLKHINLWFDEKNYVKVNHLEQYERQLPPREIGHFTAMVTDRNYAVGCAAVELREIKIVDGWQFNKTVILTACNYASTNFIHHYGDFKIPVYEFGKPTSECKTGRNIRFPNLCSRNEIYEVNSFQRYRIIR